MTTVPFDLDVSIKDDRGRIKKYGTVEFRFTTKSARQLEIAAGAGIQWLVVRGQTVQALVLLVCYGLKWADEKMTEDRATDVIDAFVERGGDTAELSKAAYKALNDSGVYGKIEQQAEEETEPPPLPVGPTANVTLT